MNTKKKIVIMSYGRCQAHMYLDYVSGAGWTFDCPYCNELTEIEVEEPLSENTSEQEDIK